ncbi:MAG: type II toxin-antitoxin system HipA family toxin [Lachnospiraceae bacterium]|jgi:serine/threonine-protein kinase HipA|nr:type II toxin-antitoxin system HipA family toxin [Lachnospiraceae bacterium]MCI9100426.1 type II toxin-antitoxin system HipA family toxin [Lachnospiraceae bacterium]
MRVNNRLKVLYHGREVGTLAFTSDKKAAFEYSGEWIESGFSISPFSLPLKKQVFVPVKLYFHGLFGVFADSLPDAWGNLLLSRMLRKKGISMDDMSPLDRLAIVGSSGMGALVYQPEMMNSAQEYPVDLDELSVQCRQILTTEYDENLDELYRLGGTSGGARPKILTEVEKEDWIIKFPAHVDTMNAGQMEYEYSLCAKQCGISMSETRLFPSRICGGYFGTKRFDRENQKIHMCTAAALLELDYNQPSLDYHSLMKLTKIITGNNQEDIQDMYRRMCFNVFAHNRDDHSKNFAFLYDESRRRWKLSPAYDLTYSNTYYGEHTTSVDGNGRDPGVRELINVGTAAGMKKEKCRNIAEQIKSCVKEHLGNYLKEP